MNKARKRLLIGATSAAAIVFVLWNSFSYEPLGLLGDDVKTTLTVQVIGERGDEMSALMIPMPGKVLFVRFTPSGTGMNAKVQTTEGWYEFLLSHAKIDWAREKPVSLRFAYKDGKAFREELEDVISQSLSFLGFAIGRNAEMGCPARPGDVSEIGYCEVENGGASVFVDTTRKMTHSAGTFNIDAVIEVRLSP